MKTDLVVRKQVQELEAAIKSLPNSYNTIPVNHHFAPGVYGRESLILAGHTVVGKIHKHEHLIIVSQGKAILISAEEKLLVEAPYMGISPAKTKRAVYALSDCVITTIHPTDETDLTKIEAEVILPDFPELEDNT